MFATIPCPSLIDFAELCLGDRLGDSSSYSAPEVLSFWDANYCFHVSCVYAASELFLCELVRGQRQQANKSALASQRQPTTLNLLHIFFMLGTMWCYKYFGLATF